MGDVLLIWMVGWAIMVGSMDFMFQQAARDSEERAVPLRLRARWGTYPGRVLICLSLLLSWPLLVPLLLHSVWVWATD